MLKEKLEQIQREKLAFELQNKKKNKIALIAFLIEALIIVAIVLLRAFKVITEENEYIVYIIIAITLLPAMAILIFTRNKRDIIDFDFLWVSAVLEEKVKALELDDKSAKIVIDFSDEGRAIYVYRKDKYTPRIIIKKFNARVEGIEGEEPVEDNIGLVDEFCISDFGNWFSAYYNAKINQGKTFNEVSVYLYLDMEDKTLPDEEALWETLVVNGALTKEAKSNLKYVNMR